MSWLKKYWRHLTGAVAATAVAVAITPTKAPTPPPAPPAVVVTAPIQAPVQTVDIGTTSPIVVQARVYGVTLTDPYGKNLTDAVAALKALPHKPTARIVYDESGMSVQDFCSAAKAVHVVAYVMAEILDSQFMKQQTAAQLSARTTALLNACSSEIDIVEAGNEINGNWLGSDVAAKLSAMYDAAKAVGKKTAVTFYLDCPGCTDAPHEMFTWIDANVPARIRTGSEYILVSYYKDDQQGYQPNWQQVFDKLSSRFPSSYLGLGEYGTENAAHQVQYIKESYGLSVTTPKYIGGVFWWYFQPQMVPMSKPLWTTLSQAMQ